MSRIPLLTCLLLLCLPVFAQQNNLNTYNALSARVLAIDHEFTNQDDIMADLTFGLEIGYRRQLGKYFGLAIPLKLGTIDVGALDNISIFGMELLPTFFPLGTETKISPYLHAGYGFVTEGVETANQQIPLGGGINIKIGDDSWFGVQGEYRISNQELRDNVMVGLGYTYRLSSVDSDDDGIANKDDQCPDEPGPVSTNGCPDADLDGIVDTEDKCPQLAGLASLAGCPDSDLDGIADPDDECPELAGLASLAGCPDTDGDTIIDPEDDCPEIAGTLALNGCPDTDNDGITDAEDNCPELPGEAALKGCPDTDGDGIADPDDACPETEGVAPDGCPDSDGDGVPDKDDACPDAAGRFNGCPDTDDDGLPDNIDRCPTQVGTDANQGCPEIKEEVKATLAYAAKAVQFETGSAELKKESYITLGEIAGIMREYRDYNLMISGHTDSVGDDAKNLALSKARAAACEEYLVATGIDASRIRSTGYGETQPKADNDRSAGRRENRRVEFELALPQE